MTKNERAVSIGELVVSDVSTDVLVAYGLGSCVAVCLYDPFARVGGMLHALLPAAPHSNGIVKSPSKYVDRGVPLLIESMQRAGAVRRRTFAQVVGGAKMLAVPGNVDELNIGERNVIAARAALQSEAIPIQAEASGGTCGRTIRFYVGDGQVTLRTLKEGEQPLTVPR